MIAAKILIQTEYDHGRDYGKQRKREGCDAMVVPKNDGASESRTIKASEFKAELNPDRVADPTH